MLVHDAILLGGGSGTRFKSTIGATSAPVPKQFLLLNGQPVFIRALNSLLDLGVFRSIIFTVPSEHIALAEAQIAEFARNPKSIPIRVIAGGERRQDSSRIAIEALDQLDPPPTRIIIHDACRPFLSDALLNNVHQSLCDRAYGAWIPVVPVVDTLKRVENSMVVETVDRSLVHRVQTPQVFEFSVIRTLIDRVREMSELNFTDDASLCEYYGIPVGTFNGDVRNIKLTYDFELESLKNLITERKEPSPCGPASATTFTA